jgi:hypothetical protein
VLGYGVPPINPLPANWPAGTEASFFGLTDGVVVQVHSVGSNNPLGPQLGGLYTKGRCLVHEVGHYLGLQHIFGSNGGDPANSFCGTIADDGIGDTPEQSLISFDANSGFACPPATKNSCGVGIAGDLPDMWENYMDYSRDACQTLFTPEQINIIRGVMEVQRNGLVNPTSVGSLKTELPLALYPNPARNEVTVALPGEITEVRMVNMLGQEMARLVGSAANSKTYDVSTFAPGIYRIMIDAGTKRFAGSFVVSR